MKKIIQKLSLFLLCATCVVAFTCCATKPQNSEASDSQSTNVSDESSSDSGTQGDENELPRVPYGNKN